jgi:hypothetical protein
MDSVACYSLLSVGGAIVRMRMSWHLPAAGAVKEERERVTLLVGQRRGGIDQPGDVGIQADLTVVCGMPVVVVAPVVLAALAEAVAELHAQRHAAQATAARQAPDPPPHPAPMRQHRRPAHRGLLSPACCIRPPAIGPSTTWPHSRSATSTRPIAAPVGRLQSLALRTTTLRGAGQK